MSSFPNDTSTHITERIMLPLVSTMDGSEPILKLEPPIYNRIWSHVRRILIAELGEKAHEPAPPRDSGSVKASAIEILRWARVDTKSMRGTVNWHNRNLEAQAFDLFNLYNTEKFRFSRGCLPCHAKVFNWLMDQAQKP